MGHSNSKSDKNESAACHHDFWDGDVPEASHLRLDEFLFHIFQWKPEWLNDKQYNAKLPPIVDPSKVISKSLYYETFEEYCKAMMPLLLHEFWHVLKKDGQVVKETKTEDDPEKMRSISANVDSRSLRPPTAGERNNNKKMTILKLEEVVDKLEGYPIRGDLVKFKHGHEEVFGYIEEFTRTKVYYNKTWMLTYSVKTKSINFDTWNTGRLNLVTVLPLGPYLRFVRAMEDLSRSPLFQSVLKPKAEDYEMYKADSSILSLVTGHQLDAKQMEVVVRVVKTVEEQGTKICLIQGPPGTGKSKVILNIVCQVLKNKDTKILLCAPSNRAIDEVVSNLIAVQKDLAGVVEDFTLVRIGREEKMGENVKEVSLSFHTKMSRFGINSAQRRHAEDVILREADVIATTLSSCYTFQMENLFSQAGLKIPVCIVDEAAQATELGTLIPLMLGVKTLILVGDPKQLPPTVLSEKAKFHGLDESLFYRAQKNFEQQSVNPILMLDTQYRMVEPLARWPSNFFYRGILKTAADVPPLPFQNYKLLHHFSHQSENESNPGEAKLIVNLVYGMVIELIKDIKNENVSIGIITPYQKQKKLITTLLSERYHEHEPKKKIVRIIKTGEIDGNANEPPLNEDNEDNASDTETASKEEKPSPLYLKLKSIQVNTVDSFQGQERDIIVMSCVRSKGIGFVSDPNRLCVSLTRAKHTLILCGNFNTFNKNPMWKALLADAKARRAYSKVHENFYPEFLINAIING